MEIANNIVNNTFLHVKSNEIKRNFEIFWTFAFDFP